MIGLGGSLCFSSLGVIVLGGWGVGGWSGLRGGLNCFDA